MTYHEISPGIYEVPKEGSMRVPVRLVAQPHMLEHILSDRTLQQAKNVAALPGIIEASYVMPDGHEGYGFPIGGVAAFDAQDGIVSPGGVGYDINCLPEGSNILTEFGSIRKIESYENDFPTLQQNGKFQLSLTQQNNPCVASLESRGLRPQPLLAFMKKPVDTRMLRITTQAGKKVTCSEDHPVRVGIGYKVAGQIQVGERLSATYFTGVPHRKIEDETRTAIWAKLLGYFMGDGTLTESSGKLRAAAYGKKQDLELMRQDVERLGFKASVFERTRKHLIESQYGIKAFTATNAELHIYSQEFCQELEERGMPKGRKAFTQYLVPQWVRQSPQWIQRVYLAGFFGAELTAARTHTKTGFDLHVLAQNKNEIFKENGRFFLAQIMHMLEGFGIECSKIAERREHPNQKGRVIRLRLYINGNEDNLLKLYQQIGYAYSEQKRRMAEIACRYILLKKKAQRQRAETVRKVQEYKSKGLKLNEIAALLQNKPNERFIQRAYENGAKPRIHLDFVSFKEFTEQSLQEFDMFGTLQDPVESIEEVPYTGWVYDFTVADTHNFIADGIVVSNCGVRFLRTDLSVGDVQPKLTQLTDALFRNVPAGVGTKSKVRFNEQTLEPFVTHGLKHAVEQGFGVKKDLEHVEENGQMQGADYSRVSDLAKKRGAPQLGTLGSGNHFLEVQKVEKVFDTETAKAFGIFEGQITIMIHSGSRGFGHQVCDDNLRTSLRAAEKYGIKLPDPELCGTPLDSKEAEEYFGAMKCAINYAFCNRQFMTHWVRETMEQVFKKDWDALGVNPVYDVCHNIAKFEEHVIDGKKRNVCVHRKGATRAFWAGHEKVPAAYRAVGQPVIIPGSMNTSSYLLCGLPGAAKTFASSCHGAGRRMSRHMAVRQFDSRKIEAEMQSKGQVIRATQPRLLSEEAGGAYKNVDDVVGAVAQAGISKIVAKMVPLGVVKG